MWTPCEVPIDEVNEETGKMETHYHCPYANDGEYVSCRDMCGEGVDE